MHMRLCCVFLCLLFNVLSFDISSVHANDFFKGGPYIGIKGGRLSSEKTYAYDTIVNGQFGHHSTVHFGNKRDYFIGLYAGYGIRRGNFYIAPEFSAHHSFLNWKLDTIHADLGWEKILKSHLKWTIEPGLRIGYIIDQLMFYAHGSASFAYSDFKIEWISLIEGMDDIIREKSGWHPGFKLGAGVEVFLVNSISTRIEGFYTSYKARKFRFNIADTLTFDGKMNIKGHFGIVGGLSYHF